MIARLIVMILAWLSVTALASDVISGVWLPLLAGTVITCVLVRLLRR